nr:hypothetical protein [Armatimonas sp.]
MAVPLIIEALQSSPRAPDLLFQVLALMDAPSAKEALVFLQNTTSQEKATHWLGQYERRIERRKYWTKFLYPKTHPMYNSLPVSKEIFEIQSRQLFNDDLEIVQQAIETLKYQANPEVRVLFWVLADDPGTVRGLRQKAHNVLEFWRRYNGRGKR